MKKVFIALMAVGVLASCSKDDVVDVNKEAIAFGDTFIENSTRAIDPSYSIDGEDLTSFQVWGSVQDVTDPTKSTYVSIFEGENVTGTVGTGNIWNCAKTQYWIKGATYNFAAVVGGTVATLGIDKLPATISYTADGTTDLLYAKSVERTGQLTGNAPVAFTFDHLLSKVKFTVENTSTGVGGNTTGYSYQVSGLTIHNLATSGTVDVPKTAGANYVWAVGNDMANVDFGLAVTETANTPQTEAMDITDGKIAVSNYERLVIPNKYTELTVSFKLNTYYNNTLIFKDETITKTAKNVNFVPGCSYNFVIELSVGEPIEFSVTTDPTWTSGSDENVTVQ